MDIDGRLGSISQNNPHPHGLNFSRALGLSTAYFADHKVYSLSAMPFRVYLDFRVSESRRQVSIFFLSSQSQC